MRLEARQALTDHSILGQRLLPDDELVDVRVVHIPHGGFPHARRTTSSGEQGAPKLCWRWTGYPTSS